MFYVIDYTSSIHPDPTYVDMAAFILFFQIWEKGGEVGQ